MRTAFVICRPGGNVVTVHRTWRRARTVLEEYVVRRSVLEGVRVRAGSNRHEFWIGRAGGTGYDELARLARPDEDVFWVYEQVRLWDAKSRAFAAACGRAAPPALASRLPLRLPPRPAGFAAQLEMAARLVMPR